MDTSRLATLRRNTEDLHRIECPVLHRNCKLFFERYVATSSLISGEGSWSEVKNSITNQSTSLDLYENCIQDIHTKFSLEKFDIKHLNEALEILAFRYEAEFQTVVRRKSITEILAQITDFTEDLEKYLKPVERDTDVYRKLFGNLSSGDPQADIYAQAFKDLIKANETLQELPEFIRQSKVAKFMNLGKRAPVGNPALERWTKSIHTIWTDSFSRTVENKNDGLNGRKYLLRFMEMCIQPVHKAIEYDTLDNMLRKVQQNVV